MASIRKKGTSYVVDLYVKGKRESKSFPSKAQARDWALERERELRIATDAGEGYGKTVYDLLQRYAREVSPTKKSHTKEVIRINAMCKEELALVLLTDLDTIHVAAWRDRRLQSVSGSSVVRECNLLSHAFRIAEAEWKWLKHNPMPDIRRPKESAPRDRRITPEEEQMILSALGYHSGIAATKSCQVAVAFLFALETAMRAKEIVCLKPSDIEGKVAILRDTKTVPRRVGLSARALELLAQLPNGVFDITTIQLDALWRKARAKTPIKDLHFHDTRHEAITRLAQKIDVLDLARMTGHKNINQLMVYYNRSAAEVAELL